MINAFDILTEIGNTDVFNRPTRNFPLAQSHDLGRLQETG